MPVDYSLFRRVRLPKWKAAPILLLFLLSLCLSPLSAVAAPKEQPNSPYFHIVKPGDSLARIAELYGVSVQALRESNNLVNLATVVSCDHNADSTQARGTVRLNDQPVNDYRVVFSWEPDGQVVARAITGGGGQAGGQFNHILGGSGPREGNWWFWIENDAGDRISEMAYVHTDEYAHRDSCQRAVIDFDIRNLDLTYIGRRLHIPVGGSPAVVSPVSTAYQSFHIVRPAQTLASIAALYDVSVEDLRTANSLSKPGNGGGLRPQCRQHKGAGHSTPEWPAGKRLSGGLQLAAGRGGGRQNDFWGGTLSGSFHAHPSSVRPPRRGLVVLDRKQ